MTRDPAGYTDGLLGVENEDRARVQQGETPPMDVLLGLRAGLRGHHGNLATRVARGDGTGAERASDGIIDLLESQLNAMDDLG